MMTMIGGMSTYVVLMIQITLNPMLLMQKLYNICGYRNFFFRFTQYLERDHTYREEIYKKNDYNVIFVHAYKDHKDWKRFLIKRIMAIEERRHDEVMKMLQALQF